MPDMVDDRRPTPRRSDASLGAASARAAAAALPGHGSAARAAQIQAWAGLSASNGL